VDFAKKPPADLPNINDLRQCLTEGARAGDIGDFLCRDVDEVKRKVAEFRR
jgi:hypothetical protein